MAIRSDIGGFPLSGIPALTDVGDRLCLGTLYRSPLRPLNLMLDIVGSNRLLGSLTISGALSGVTTLATSGTLTNTYASVLFSRSTYGINFTGTSSSAVLPIQNSAGIIFGGSSWNGTTAATQSISQYLNVYSGAATSSGRLVWRSALTNGATTNSDLMSLSTEGNLDILGTTVGSEILATADFATNANWTVSGDWAYTTGDYTFTYSTGSGTLTQASSAFLTPLKPNSWYKFLPEVGVAGPSGTVAWIGTECADRRYHFQVSSTTEVPIYFKTNSAPGNFVIYTTANATSGLRLDAVSLKEVTGGCLTITGCLKSDGGIYSKVKTVTDTYQILNTDYTVVGNKATPFTITLPTAIVGQILNIKNIGVGTITLEGNGADTIDGAANQTINQWANMKVQCYAANSWVII